MKQIKAGIIGLGRLGRKHAADVAARIPGVSLHAACSIVEDELKIASKLGVQNLYTDYRDLLSCPELDAVVIVSPSPLHKRHVIDAVDANLHIFCEKPLALTLEDCIAIEKTVEKMQDRIFMLGFMRRFDPSYLRVKKILDAGKAGHPIVFKGNSLDPISGIDEFLAFARTSGGPFLDMAIHDIDLALWFLDSEVESVYALGSSFVKPEIREFGDNDNAFCVLKFKNDTIAILHAGRTAPNGYQVDAEIVCTNATFRVNAVPRLDRVDEFTQDGIVTQCEQRFFQRFDDAYVLEKECFFDCIKQNKRPPIGAKDGTRATLIALAATESMRTGKIVYL